MNPQPLELVLPTAFAFAAFGAVMAMMTRSALANASPATRRATLLLAVGLTLVALHEAAELLAVYMGGDFAEPWDSIALLGGAVLVVLGFASLAEPDAQRAGDAPRASPGRDAR
ncbi:MAG: hypothetical protein ACYDCK_12150 [Thermoplasmatota archaeon]